MSMQTLHFNRPHAIMVVGLPGSGKSFFAEQFSKTFNAPLIDAYKIIPLAKDETAANEFIRIIMDEVSKTGQTFLYEGDLDSRVNRTEFSRWAREIGYEPLLIWSQVDAPTARKRTQKARSLAPIEFNERLKHFSPPHVTEKPIVISGKHTYATQAKVVLTKLSMSQTGERTQTSVPTRPDSTSSRSIPVR